MAAAKKVKTPQLGPRGGVTTVSQSTGLMKKAMYLYHDQWEILRKISYEENRPASDIVREALLAYFEAKKAAKKKPAGPAPGPAAESA